jgi:hypothetical protein
MLKIPKGMERIALSFLAIILAYTFIIIGISIRADGSSNEVADAISKQVDPKHMGIFVQITEIQPLKGEATARICLGLMMNTLGFVIEVDGCHKKISQSMLIQF